MWDQVYTPVAGSLGLSALVAALPIAVMLFSLGVLRLAAWKSGLLGLATVMVVAGTVYGMPLPLLASATLYGAAFGLFPIAWIVFWAVALYRLTVETGQFEIIKNSVGHLTPDRRLQALFIAFAFGAFVEGASGFGTPVAVASAMLAGLGFLTVLRGRESAYWRTPPRSPLVQSLLRSLPWQVSRVCPWQP